MRLLILGGTVFLGRATAAHAASRGHEVICAARGVSGPVPPGVMLVPVDRDRPDGLAPLDGQTFDAVIEVGRVSSHVRRAVADLDGRTGHWTFVSSISVYADQSTPGGQVADTPLLPPAPPEIDDPNSNGAEHYGACKVACEQAVLAAGRPSFICRPGLIVGPEDPTDRFTYWPVRLARPDGGAVLAPGAPDDRVQIVDVRDLAAWLVHAAETGLTGIYDGTGVPMSWADFLAAIADGVGANPELIWVDQGFLLDQGVQPWMGPGSLPVWLPLPDYAGMINRDVSAAVAAGLTCRPLAETARDTLAWHRAIGAPELKCGLDPADEARVREAWRTSHP